jgi:hypothetical protein
LQKLPTTKRKQLFILSMAFNPPLLPGGLPAGIVGEYFCLEREGIELSVDTQTREHGKQVLRRCRLFMTTLRLCLVCPSPNGSGLQSFDVPLQGISAESFEQPWFGANYLALTVAPVPGRGLVSPAKVKLTFNQGGCGLFLRVFFTLMAKYKEADASARASFLAAPSMQGFISHAQTAFVDRAWCVCATQRSAMA